MTDKQLSEVYDIIIALGSEYIKKTPPAVLSFIAENRDKNFITKVDKSKPLHEQGLSSEVIAFIAMLKLKSWCDTDEQKNELKRILKKNVE